MSGAEVGGKNSGKSKDDSESHDHWSSLDIHLFASSLTNSQEITYGNKGRGLRVDRLAVVMPFFLLCDLPYTVSATISLINDTPVTRFCFLLNRKVCASIEVNNCIAAITKAHNMNSSWVHEISEKDVVLIDRHVLCWSFPNWT